MSPVKTRHQSSQQEEVDNNESTHDQESIPDLDITSYVADEDAQSHSGTVRANDSRRNSVSASVDNDQAQVESALKADFPQDSNKAGNKPATPGGHPGDNDDPSSDSDGGGPRRHHHHLVIWRERVVGE